MSRNSEKWLVLQWNNGGIDMVHVRSLANTSCEDLQVGEPVTATVKGEQKTGKLVAKSHERNVTEQILAKMKVELEAGPSTEPEEPADFSASTSSWAPSECDDDNASDSEMETKIVKLDENRRQYSNSRSKKRILTPSHRANAVIPEGMQSRSNETKNTTRKRTYNESIKQTKADKSLPDSTKRNTPCVITLQNVSIDLNDIIGLKECFRDLFQMVKDMKSLNACENISTKSPEGDAIRVDVSNDEKENERSRSVESNRSDDNMLITNKYERYKAHNNSPSQNQSNNMPNTAKAGEDEWVPIGSGKTLLHKEKFRKVNWKSYTIATRTLLLALFPRRILATHSLTGKRSPAFQNKPAKMCLDPKIISDVIIEIQDRFHVKENLIRSIITTKCADECKMYKARQVKKRMVANQENTNNEPNEDRSNVTV